MKFAMALLSHSISENNAIPLRRLRGKKKSCNPFAETLAEDMFGSLAGHFKYCVEKNLTVNVFPSNILDRDV